MTRTEAQDIITKAIAAEGPIAGTLSIDAFAQRIATALDALGLLDHCAMSIAPPVPGDPLGRAVIEPTGAKSPDDLPWATQRQRS